MTRNDNRSRWSLNDRKWEIAAVATLLRNDDAIVTKAYSH